LFESHLLLRSHRFYQSAISLPIYLSNSPYQEFSRFITSY